MLACFECDAISAKLQPQTAAQPLGFEAAVYAAAAEEAVHGVSLQSGTGPVVAVLECSHLLELVNAVRSRHSHARVAL